MGSLGRDLGSLGCLELRWLIMVRLGVFRFIRVSVGSLGGSRGHKVYLGSRRFHQASLLVVGSISRSRGSPG